MAAARNALGDNFVNMGVRIVKPKGFFGFLKTSEYEITAAVEDDVPIALQRPSFGASGEAGEGKDAVEAKEKSGVSDKKEKSGIPSDNRNHSVDLAANEEIDLNEFLSKAGLSAPAPNDENAAAYRNRPVRRVKPQQKPNPDVITDAEVIEKKLGDLQGLLEQSLSNAEKEKEKEREIKNRRDDTQRLDTAGSGDENGFQANQEFVRVLYSTLLDNEVDERYVNRLLSELSDVIREGTSVDLILSNVYQKMVLNFGRPETIPMDSKKPRILFFIGPTGVGKTTTIAKLAGDFFQKGKSVVLLTADTYRMAATDQLRKYANILHAPMEVVYSEGDMLNAIEKYSGCDYLFVDTAGFSHKNEKQKEDTGRFISSVPEKYGKSVYLVLSSTTKYRDLKEICDVYKTISDYSIVFTKLDETNVYGNIYNIRLYTGAAVSYITNGQNVPEDISVLDTQAIVKKLLGGGR